MSQERPSPDLRATVARLRRGVSDPSLSILGKHWRDILLLLDHFGPQGCDREQVADTLRAVQASHQELLAALKDMEKWADVCCDTMSLAQAKEYLRIREAARDAIARAEGR